MIIFTDGSHSTKPRMSGLGAVILYKDKEYSVGTYTNQCRDNNVAEIASIAMAIQYISNNKILDRMEDKNITIISDSETALRKIKQKCVGKDEFECECLEYIQEFLDFTNKKVSFLQIKGHVHDGTKLAYYNNIADDIAGDYRRLGLELQQKHMNKKKTNNNFHRHIKFGKDR